jgi:hypothetical protein
MDLPLHRRVGEDSFGKHSLPPDQEVLTKHGARCLGPRLPRDILQMPFKPVSHNCAASPHENKYEKKQRKSTARNFEVCFMICVTPPIHVAFYLASLTRGKGLDARSADCHLYRHHGRMDAPSSAGECNHLPRASNPGCASSAPTCAVACSASSTIARGLA